MQLVCRARLGCLSTQRTGGQCAPDQHIQDRFPDCQVPRLEDLQFISQYREIIQAESAVLHDSDGTMVDERGEGRAPHKGCGNAVCLALGRPCDNKRFKGGKIASAFILTTMCAFRISFPGLRRCLSVKPPRRRCDDERQQLLNRVMSERNSFASTGMDLHPTAQSMVLGRQRCFC